MVHGSADSRETILDSLFVDCLPDGTTSNVGSLVRCVDTACVHVARQVDHEAAFGGRRACGVVSPTANRDRKADSGRILDCARDVVDILDEGDDACTTRRVCSPAQERLFVLRVAWGDDVALEGALELFKAGHDHWR